MPRRDRVVRMAVVRVPFVEVERARHQALVKGGKATQDEITASFARVKQADEDGDSIDVKERLNVGESRAIYAGAIVGKEMRQGEEPRIDPEKVGITKLTAWLVGWSFLQEDGSPLPYSPLMTSDEKEEQIKSLSPETYVELDAAVDYHIERVAQEREARKNFQGGETNFSPTSPSPVV